MKFARINFSLLIFSVSFSTAISQTLNPWNSIGPFGKVPIKGNPSSFRGNGLVNCVEVHPTDTNTVFIGTEGGLWVSSSFGNPLNGRGNTWVPLATTNELPGSKTICIGNVLVDKTDPNTIYVSTGVKEFSRLTWFYMPSQYTTGIYRYNTSTAITGGTWTNISNGLPSLKAFDVNGYFKGYVIPMLKQDPLDSNILYAGTTYGLYRTTNAKAASPTWVKVTSVPSVPIKSMAFTNVNKQNRTCSYYISGDGVLLKTNDFVNWTSLVGSCSNCVDVTSSYYLNNVGNAAVNYFTFYLSSSQKNPNKVYISLLTSSSARTQRYILSHDGTSLQNLTQLSDKAPSGWGGGNTAMEPVIASVWNPAISLNEYIVLGFQNIEGIYENGSGYTYFANSRGYSTENCKDCHADIRDLKVSSNNRFIYCANDGFLSRFNIFAPYSLLTTGCSPTPWEKIDNNGLAVSRLLHLSVAKDNQTIYTGLMDDGVDFYTPSKGWQSIVGGDGLDQLAQGGFVVSMNNDQNYPTYLYTTPQNPTFAGVINGAGPGTWYYKSLYKDPKDTTVFYNVRGSRILKYKIENGVITRHDTIAKFDDAQHFWFWRDASAFAISPSNPLVIYLAFSTAYNENPAPANFLYVTKSGGLPLYYDWQSISLPSANTHDLLRCIAVSHTSTNTLFIGYGNAATGRPRVYKTSDGGTTWSDYNNSQNSIPSRCQIHSIVYEKGSNDGVYVGTDNGVYYTNRGMTSWIEYNNGLPAIPVTEMEFNIARNNITAATFGRGIWQANTYCPVAGNITLNNTNLYPSGFGTSSHQANGTISYQANLSVNAVTLKATTSILFQAGSSFTPSANKELDAYLAPCTGNSTSSYRVNNGSPIYEEDPKLLPTEPLVGSPLQIFPNPNDGEFNVTFKMKTGDIATMYIYDMNGMIIYTKEFSHEHQIQHVELKQNEKGVYLLKVVKNKKEIFTDKVIVGIIETEEESEAPSLNKDYNKNSSTGLKEKKNRSKKKN
ncbi:MAG: T9SS type A sorting domain-containing protein [Opitutaceae bacterium]|nr:T9SS type A sorting domain-containing protein [Cytophagales bacterium]